MKVIHRTNAGRTLCVVCPCYNEEEIIVKFYEKLKSVVSVLPNIRHSILFVDDGSTDSTLGLLNQIAKKDRHVLVYSFSRNFGQQAALTAGLNEARADAVIIMDSDLQHPPELIPKMIDQWKEGAEVVSAVRLRTRDAGFMKRVSSRLFYWVFGKISDTRVLAGGGNYCLLSKRAQAALNSMPERQRFVRALIEWVGFERRHVPYVADSRGGGKTKYSFNRMLSLSFDAIFSFSAEPIRLAYRLGFFIIALCSLTLVYWLLRYFAYGEFMKGWVAVVASVFFLGGIQLIFIGILGEYLGRVFDQVKGRPHYLFRQVPGESKPFALDSRVAKFKASGTFLG
ncbi:MAG: glycosyltransferase family 2 protein [Deltaproteobacteria bacterium]|nr:glycosyltransferase family 2 protein [Deltaproteobacteria bacterium]